MEHLFSFFNTKLEYKGMHVNSNIFFLSTILLLCRFDNQRLRILIKRKRKAVMWLFWWRKWGSAFNTECINVTFILLSRVLSARFRSGVFSEGETACHWEGKVHWEPKSGFHTGGKDTKCYSMGVCGGVAGAKGSSRGELYSQVHKYWDSDSIWVILLLYTKQWIWNEAIKMWLKCRRCVQMTASFTCTDSTDFPWAANTNLTLNQPFIS